MKNTKKEVLRNCIPAMVCMVISGLTTIIDGLFIGRNIGEDGLAAINIAWPVPAFIIASGIGIGVGCGINYVSALGKKHEKEAKEFLKNAFVFLACAGILYSVIFEMTAPYLMKMLGAEGKVHTLAVQYTRIIAAAALLQIFGAGLVPIVRNLNMPIQAMAATISGVCSNFVFNTIFIFVLQMGMRGAALGTVLSQVVTSVIAGVSIKKSGALSREDVEEKAEKTGKLYKTIAKEGQVVEFAPLKEKEIITWLRKTCASGGVQLSEAMAVLLLRTTDNSMENLQREMDKLIAYKDGAGEITQEDISAVCSVSLEAKVFELVRAMGEKKTEKAISIYSNLLSLKESPYMVLSLLTRQFRMILGSALLSAEGAAQAEIASRLEVRDFAVREYLRQSKSFSIKELEQALADCLETDLDIKSGRMAEDLAVELLLMKYSSPSFS